MPRITLENSFRFLFPSFVFIVCLWVTDPTFQGAKIVTLSACGIIFYALYRIVPYDYLISRIVDSASGIFQRPTYRLWLTRRYDLTASTAEEIYAGVIRPHFKELNTKSIRERSALIHMLYQSGIIVLLFPTFSLFAPSLSFASIYVGWMLTVGIGLLMVALFADVRIDRQIQRTLQHSQTVIDRLMKDLGIKKRRG